MKKNNYLETHYLEIYQKLNQSLETARKLVRKALPFEKEIQELIKEIEVTRKKLDRIFSSHLLSQICSQCHKRSKGGCCKNKRDSYLSWGDLIYIISENIEFELPFPDIEFLKSFKNPPCLFLGPKQCLLKEKRPIICLGLGLNNDCDDLCRGIEKLINSGILFEGQMASLLDGLKKKTGLLCNKIPIKPKFNRDFIFAPGPI